MALLESPQTRPADPQCAGLAHLALHHARDREVSQSLYFLDPDGLLIEVYVGADPALWAARPEAVATVRPLQVAWLD